MSLTEIENYLRENKVECNLSIKQPWILWRKESSLITLEQVSDKLKYLE